LNKVEEFKSLSEIYDKPQLVAKIVLMFPKEVSSKLGKSFEEVDEILGEFYGDVLLGLKKKKISEGDIKDIMIKLVNGEDFKEAIKIEKMDNLEIEEKILKIIKSKPGLNPNAYMGLVMKEFKGKVDGKTAMQIIGKLLK